MILVDHEIKDAVTQGTLGIKNFDPEFVQPASYDRIGLENKQKSSKAFLKLRKAEAWSDALARMKSRP